MYLCTGLVVVGGGVGLSVDVAAVTDGQGKDDEAVIVECAYEAVVADAVAPQSRKITGEGLAVAAGIAALFPELYEAVTERPAWLDAKSDGPMADALRPLREASQDEDGEDR